MNSLKNTKKSLQRDKLVLAALEQPSWEKAAAAAGISYTTAWRISKTPEYKKEYLEALRKCFSQSLARLQHASGAAASTLMRIMLDPKAPAAARVRACATILHCTGKLIELEDLEVRISELERSAAASRQNKTNTL